jgi:hypothetical protein
VKPGADLLVASVGGALVRIVLVVAAPQFVAIADPSHNVAAAVLRPPEPGDLAHLREASAEKTGFEQIRVAHKLVPRTGEEFDDVLYELRR